MFARSALRFKVTILKGLGLQDEDGHKFHTLRSDSTTSADTSLDLEVKDMAFDEERAERLNKQSHPVLYNDESRLTFSTIISLFLLVLTLNIRLWQSSGRNQTTATKPPPPKYLDGFEIQTDSKGHYIQCPTTSSTTARQNPKCNYDVMIYGWLPPPCFNKEMYTHLTSNKDWGFYADRNGTLPIPQTDLMKGIYETQPEAWVSNEEHWQHCRYLHNTSIAFREGVPSTALDVHLDPHHMGHCLEFITDPEIPRTKAVTRTKAKFGVGRKCYVLVPAPG